MLDINTQTNADGKQYRVCNGTWYHANTLDDVIRWLETFRERRDRIRVTYGVIFDGQVSETHKRVGYVDRSAGPMKIPLIVYNDRCINGDTILSEQIVKFEYANKRSCKKVIWSHPAYLKTKKENCDGRSD